MKRKIMVGVIAVAIIGLVVGGYYMSRSRNNASEEIGRASCRERV